MKLTRIFICLALVLSIVSCASSGITGSLVSTDPCVVEPIEGVVVSVAGNNITDGYGSVALSIINNSPFAFSIAERQISFFYRNSEFEQWKFLGNWDGRRFLNEMQAVQGDKVMRADFWGDLLTFNVALFNALVNDEYDDMSDVYVVDFLTDINTVMVGLHGEALLAYIRDNMFTGGFLPSGTVCNGVVFFRDVAPSAGEYMIVIDLGSGIKPSFVFRKALWTN